MIPKILHIIWIGDDNLRPEQLIQTWTQHHPDWQVWIWGNDDLVGRQWRCQAQIRYWGTRDCGAVADIMRWEILLEHGGVCVAADSICLRPLDEALLDSAMFGCWASEVAEPGVVSAAYIGCEPGHALMARVVHDIQCSGDDQMPDASTSVGSARLTRSWQDLPEAALTVLPSQSFIPRHPLAPIQDLTQAPYACELWAGRLGLTKVLHSMDVGLLAGALGAPESPISAPRKADGINVVMLTVRTTDTMRDIVDTLVRTASRDARVRLTIADGSMDPGKAQWLTQLAARTGADMRLIFEPGIVERFKAALTDDKAWTLFVSDDDHITNNYLDEYLHQLDALEPGVVALAPALYVGKMSDRLLLNQVKPCSADAPAHRLQAWQAQHGVQGVLYYSLIRTPVVLEWSHYLSTKTHAPSYSDQLLTALIASRGKIAVVKGASVLVRDESGWETLAGGIESDKRFYPRSDMVLIHEGLWVADLVRMLDIGRHPELAAALKPRAAALLNNMFEMVSARATKVTSTADIDWQAVLRPALHCYGELVQAEKRDDIARAFQAIERWATETESRLLNAQPAPKGRSSVAQGDRMLTEV